MSARKRNMKRKAAAIYRLPEYFSFRKRMKIYRKWIFHIDFLRKVRGWSRYEMRRKERYGI